MVPLLLLLSGRGVRAESPVSSVEVLDLQGVSHSFSTRSHGVTVVLFFSTRCPLSNAFNYRRNVLFQEFHESAQFLLVDPNATEPLPEVRAYAEQTGFDIPAYLDMGGKLADRLGVRATTDAIILDGLGVIRYRGNIENAPNPERATQHALRDALQAVLAGHTVPVSETRPIGCAIRRSHASAETRSLSPRP